MEIAEFKSIGEFIICFLSLFLLPIGILGLVKLDSLTKIFSQIVHKSNILKTPETPEWWNKKIWFLICLVLILGGIANFIKFIPNVIKFIK